MSGREPDGGSGPMRAKNCRACRAPVSAARVGAITDGARLSAAAA